jgi:hypothetical protein
MPKLRTRIYSTVRTLHIYLTLFALVMLIFFAATGFLLNHKEWFADKVQRIDSHLDMPLGLVQSNDQVGMANWLREHTGAVGPAKFDPSKPEDTTYYLSFRAPGKGTDITINREIEAQVVQSSDADPTKPQTQQVFIPIKPVLDKDEAAITAALRDRAGVDGTFTYTWREGAKPLEVAIRGDGQSSQVSIPLTVKADVTAESSGAVGRLMALHKAEDAPTQWKLLVDSVAILLALGSLSGFILWFQLPKRRIPGLIAIALSLATLGAVYFIFVP